MGTSRNRRAEHRWHPVGRLNFHYCVKCGIITLRNKATHKVIQAACKDKEDDFD